MNSRNSLTELVSLALQEKAADVMVTPASQAEQKFWNDREPRARRKRALTAIAVAATVAVAVVLVAMRVGSPRAEQVPAGNDRLSRATEFVGSSSRPKLEPGTYALHVSPALDRPVAVVDLPPRWRAWSFGPDRGTRATGYAQLIVTDVYDLVDKACQPSDDGMKALSGDPAELVRALEGMPRFTVLAGPEPDDRFGYPATHLRMRAGNTRCPFDTAYMLSLSTGIGHVLGMNAMGSEMDFWVVDAGDRASLVIASWDPTTAAGIRAELRSVVDSLEFVPSR
jgi:hypothetical protein